MTRRFFQRSLACFILLLAALPAASPARGTYYYVPRVPDDMSQVDFYLTTIGIGHEVNDRFGHTGIRIVNHLEGSDVVFNWGMYSFNEDSFLWKFFRGELDYSMGVQNFRADVAGYREMGRRMVMEPLQLTVTQKRILMERIADNAIPSHRKFSYQYWYKNCATIPRDYLDEALSGEIRKAFSTQPAHRVYRDYVRENLAYTPFVAPSLDILMNGNIDQPITVWQDMFLPDRLRVHLLELPQVNDGGVEVPGTHLLGPTQVLLDNPEDYGRRFDDSLVMIAPFLIPMLGFLWSVWRSAVKKQGPQRSAFKLLGLACIYWGLFTGIFGFTLLLNWGFSGHPDGWHNSNLWLFWPVDLWLFVFGIRLFRRAEAYTSGLRWRVGRCFCMGHLLTLGLLIAMPLMHLSDQNIWRVAAYFGSCTVVLMLSLLRWALPPPSKT